MADETYLQQNAIDDHDLDLTLGLPIRPLNYYLPCEARYSKIVPETSNGQITGKREQQAIRCQEARVKGDLKRKAGLCFNPQNGVVIEEDREENCAKVVKLGFQLFAGNAGGFQAYQGYNGHSGRKSDGENRASVSSGANSSGISDNYHTYSAAGGTSSDSSSHSSQPHMHFSAADTKQTASSEQEQTPLKSRKCSKSPEPNLSPKKGQVEIGQSPKANGQSSLVAQMPCVTTTGNGPEGKTISGFLYKYTKKEVSIVCVCHGASFSPAGFVKHAGGVDIEHPLKHIRISPLPRS